MSRPVVLSTGASKRLGLALALTLGVLLLYLVDRWLILAGSGHLLFDLNPAEQGFVRVLAPWLDQPLGEILSGSVSRRRFLHDSQAVGNQVHGTLALAAGLLHGVVRGGASLGTATMRAVALGLSSLTLLLWSLALWRASGRLRALLAFGLLFVVAPPVLLKLSLVHWGTHEWVMLLHAGLMALVVGWLEPPKGPWRARVQVALLGVIAAPLVIASHALALPLAGLGAWLVGRVAVDGWRRKQRMNAGSRAHAALVAAAEALLAIALGAGAFLLALQLLRSTGCFAGLGEPSGIAADAPILAGKQGRSFLVSQGRELLDLTLWNDEIAARAMPLVPGPGYGRHAVAIEPLVRLGVALMGLSLCWRPARRAGGSFGAFCGLYLVVGWVAVTLLGQATGLDPGIPAGIQPRYYAHLYPVALAVVALWAAEGRPWLRWPVVGLLLFFAGVGHRLLVDLDQPLHPAEMPVARCDLSRLWLLEHSDRQPPRSVLPLSEASDAWLRGAGIIERWRYRDYWRWRRPGEVDGFRRGVNAHASEYRESATEADFWRGVGCGLACLLPPSRRTELAPVHREHPAWAEELQQGCDPGSGR